MSKRRIRRKEESQSKNIAFNTGRSGNSRSNYCDNECKSKGSR